MTCDDMAFDAIDDDFQRWYHGGSPPETDGWPRDGFTEALEGRIALASAEHAGWTSDTPRPWREAADEVASSPNTTPLRELALATH